MKWVNNAEDNIAFDGLDFLCELQPGATVTVKMRLMVP